LDFRPRQFVDRRSISVLTLTAACLAILICNASSQELPELAGQIVGSEFVYAIKPGDTFTSIGSRYGVGPSVLAAANDMKVSARFKPGQVIQIDNRHIAPHELEDGILVNVPQRMVFLFRNGKSVSAYPAALGRPTWPTSTGGFHVLELREHPIWHVPASIQREMAMEGKVVKEVVPPGPDNPLGDYFVALSIGGYGIHSTSAPLSIYGFRTHGCIRLHPDDAAALFDQVQVGEPGLIIYAPVLMAGIDGGQIFLEVHRDVYKKCCPPIEAVHHLADFNNVADMIDWKVAKEVAERRDGLARDISLKREP